MAERPVSNTQHYFIENLTLQMWATTLWPRLLLGRLRNEPKVRCCYVIDGSDFNIRLARATARVLGVRVEKLDFELVQMRDSEGRAVKRRIIFDDMARVQGYALHDQGFEEFSRKEPLEGRLLIYLAKQMASTDRADPLNMWRTLNLIQVCSWKMRSIDDADGMPILFLERRPWLPAIERYAREEGIGLVTIRPSTNVRRAMRRRLPPATVHFLRRGRQRLGSRKVNGHRSGQPDRTAPAQTDGRVATQILPATQPTTGPRVAAGYYGQLNLGHPERHSDFFFWQQSKIRGSDLLAVFSIPRDPLDSEKLAELTKHGIEALVLHPEATTVSGLPVFSRASKKSEPRSKIPGPHGQWLRGHLVKYDQLRTYWSEIAEEYRIKVYTTWFKYDATHCAIADGIQEAGGVTAIYQRAYEEEASPETTIGADISFGFSPRLVEVERRSNSEIRHHVAVGYLGDHRFPLLREQALSLRQSIHNRGARHIVAYLDENSSDDARWRTGHHLTQRNYAFLLEKVLEEPWFGLVLKPKAPDTLKRRLGAVAELLARAEATGRCFVYNEGILLGSHSPAAAALSADISIHGHMNAMTAGMEAALAGVPTLMLDLEGWGETLVHRLDAGRVVFTDWADLWGACREHWNSPQGLSGLGDWSPILDYLDPFRDGCAAERMGDYIKWILEGFGDGLDREQAMDRAADRYCQAWGRDKITEVRPEAGLAQPSGATYAEATSYVEL